MNLVLQIVFLTLFSTGLWGADVRQILASADLQVRSGNYESAVQIYRLAIKMEPGDETTYDKLGGVYVRLGRLQEAAQMYERAADVLMAKSAEQGRAARARLWPGRCAMEGTPVRQRPPRPLQSTTRTTDTCVIRTRTVSACARNRMGASRER